MSQQDKIDERTAELIQGGLDDALDAAQRDELDALLGESAAARAVHAELSSINSLLDATPQIEPPEYLKNVILANVTLPAKPTASETSGFFSRWLGSFSLQSGFALTLAVVLMAGLYQMGSDPSGSSDTAQMVGTVVQSPALLQRDLDTDRVNGQVQMHRLDSGLALDFNLESDSPFEIRVDLSDSGLHYAGLQLADAGDSPGGMKDIDEYVSDTANEVIISSSGKLHATLKLGQEPPISKTRPMSLAVALWVEGESFPVNLIKLSHNADLKGFDKGIKPE